LGTTLSRQETEFFHHKLDNGLQILGQHMPDLQSAAATFWVCTGTRDEYPEQMGVSHFLEHMAFRRTERYTGEEIDLMFEELGAEHNAATWLEMTFYWAKVLGENLPQTIDILAQLLRPVLDVNDFDQERNVILEEIARYRDFPNHVLFDNFMQRYFGSHPLSRETLGTPETISALTRDQMHAYWQGRYGASNVIFAVAGNFDWDTVVSQVETLTREWQPGEAGRDHIKTVFQPGFNAVPHSQFVQQQFAIGTPMVARGDPRFYAAYILATVLGDDTGSRLFWSVHETGLAESVSASLMEFEDTGLFLLHLATEPALAKEAFRATMSELERLQSFDVTPGELDRAKAKVNSSIIIGGESSYERMMSLIRSWLTYGRLESLEETRAKIEAVTLSQMEDLIQSFPVHPRVSVTALGPMSELEIMAAS
jgi:predicted Zn-dependent peptidase